MPYLLQKIFNGSIPDGSFTMAVSNSFLSPLEKIPRLKIYEIFRLIFLFYTEHGFLCVLILMRTHNIPSC